MRKIFPLTFLSVSCATIFPVTVSALSMSPPPRANPQPSKFVFKDASGKATSVDVVQSYQPKKIVRPFTTADRQLDPKKIRYGSRILLEDEELIAVDTGPAVVSRKAARHSGHNEAERNAVVIDRFFETKSQAVAWEKSHPHFMKVRVLSPGAIVSKKSEAGQSDPPSKTRVAMRETRQRSPNPLGAQAGDLYSDLPRFQSAIPIGNFYFHALLGLSSITTRDARRRTGGELVAGKLVGKGRGRPLDRFRLLQIS